MMHRQTPPRQGSFAESVTKMRESLTKSLSFSTSSLKGFKSLSNHHHTVDEMNVFASDIVSKDYIMDRFKDIRHNPRIVKLEVEDLLIARTHDSFLPVVKALLVSDRQWQYLRFVDTIPSTDFLWWQGMKHVLMREYEDSIEDLTSKYANTVCFQANIQVMAGATKQSMGTLFRSILQDKDVNSVSFCGALFGYHDSTMAPALTGIIDKQTGTLEQAFVVNVKCGWQHKTNKETAMEDDSDEQEAPENTKPVAQEGTLDDWSRVLRSLHRALRQQRRNTARSNPQDDNGSCMEASERTHTTVSVSCLSTESAQSGGSGSSHRAPRSSRHGRRPRGSHRESLPIVQGGTRRCITLPAAKDGSRSPIRSPVSRRARPAPRRAKSFQIKRPALGSLESEDADEASQTKQKPQRASSFSAKNTSLLDSMNPAKTSESTSVTDIDNLLAMPDHQPSGALDAWLHNEKPRKDVAAKAPVRKSSHHSRKSTPGRHSSDHGDRRGSSRSCSRTASSSKSPGPPLRRVRTTETDGPVASCHHRSKSKELPRRSKSLDKDGVQCVQDALSAKGVPSRTRSEGHAKMLKHHTAKSHRRTQSGDGSEWDSTPDYDWSKKPDYDWSIGDYVEKKVVPRAA